MPNANFASAHALLAQTAHPAQLASVARGNHPQGLARLVSAQLATTTPCLLSKSVLCVRFQPQLAQMLLISLLV
jgi:hypothetical protein